jgi:hypothetical protein
VGLVDNLITDGIAIVQYADDTIVCLKHDVEKARNVKLLLYVFEQLSGLKINFDKSEILTICGDHSMALSYARIFNCQIASFPLRYLGVPISASRLHVIEWIKLEEKMVKKVDVWQGGSLSSGGRNILINSSLTSSIIYHISMFLIPKTNIGRMDKLRRSFFWQGGSLKKKYNLVKWTKICGSTKKGSMGIQNLRKKNISLLASGGGILKTSMGCGRT